MIAILCFTLAITLVLAVVDFTGDAAVDFSDNSRDAQGRPKNYLAVIIEDNNVGGVITPDVVTPLSWKSGWDIKRIFWQYDRASDELLVGIECFGVCGDADGDGDPSRTSTELAALGGTDVASLGRSESFAIAIDIDYDVADVWPTFIPDSNPPFDIIVGKPAGQPNGVKANANVATGEVALLPCVQCFGVYYYHRDATLPFSRRFLKPYLTPTGELWPIDGFNLNPTPARPDIEFKILQFSDIYADWQSYLNNPKEGAPFALLTFTFAGSDEDATIGDDYVPSLRNYAEVPIACMTYDQCDICRGDSTTCMDCAGIPNGPNTYNSMDICSSQLTRATTATSSPTIVSTMANQANNAPTGASVTSPTNQSPPASTAAADASTTNVVDATADASTGAPSTPTVVVGVTDAPPTDEQTTESIVAETTAPTSPGAITDASKEQDTRQIATEMGVVEKTSDLPFSTVSIAIVVIVGVLCLLAIVGVLLLSRRKNAVSSV